MTVDNKARQCRKSIKTDAGDGDYFWLNKGTLFFKGTWLNARTDGHLLYDELDDQDNIKVESVIPTEEQLCLVPKTIEVSSGSKRRRSTVEIDVLGLSEASDKEIRKHDLTQYKPSRKG